jgi:hypothetical protein
MLYLDYHASMIFIISDPSLPPAGPAGPDGPDGPDGPRSETVIEPAIDEWN